VDDTHHGLSHHMDNPEKIRRLTVINTFHVELLAYLLRKLKSTPEADGTLLDHCMVSYGAGIADPYTHSMDNVPALLCGGGNKTLSAGRHIRVKDQTPLSNVWLSMLDRMGLTLKSFGDSTGRLAELS